MLSGHARRAGVDTRATIRRRDVPVNLFEQPASADHDPADMILFHGAGHRLSNFHRSSFTAPHPFTGEPVVYETVEHYFQAHKSATAEGHDEVVACTKPKDAKVAGRRVPIRGDWEQFKTSVMLDGLRHKFVDPLLRQYLFDTRDRWIGEDSDRDFEWGIRDPNGGYGGRNLLGLALMRVRDEIRAEHIYQSARLALGLERLAVDKLFHITRAHALPAIARDGELRSMYARVRSEPSPQPQSGHGWAQGLTWGYVALSFQPAWWLCKRYDEELVVLEVDARAALQQPGSLTSPVNCAVQEVSESDLLATTNLGPGAAAGLAACFDIDGDELSRSVPKKGAEVLVHDHLSLEAVVGLVFCDETAREYWWPQLADASHLAHATVRVSGDGGPGLPPDWAAMVRRRPPAG